MRSFSLSHVADDVLIRDLSNLVARDRTTTAEVLAHLAEVEVRKLYVPAGHPSLRSYCVGVLRMSDDEAGRRIHVANKARIYPALLEAIANGRLHLTGASLLAAHLTPENVGALLAASEHRSKSEIEHLVACIAPRPDVPTTLRPITVATPAGPPRVPGHVPEHARPLGFEPAPARANADRPAPEHDRPFAADVPPTGGHVPEHVAAPEVPAAGRHVPEHVAALLPPSRCAPCPPEAMSCEPRSIRKPTICSRAFRLWRAYPLVRAAFPKHSSERFGPASLSSRSASSARLTGRGRPVRTTAGTRATCPRT